MGTGWALPTCPIAMPRRVSLLAPLLLLAGCGGGSGAASEEPLDQSLACGTSYRTPNYVTDRDPSSNRTNRILAWPSFPIRVYAEDRDTDLIDRAMNRWVEASGTGSEQLTWSYVNDRDDADIVIQSEELDEAPGSGDTLAVTELRFNSSSNLLSSAVVTLYTWPDMTATEAGNGLRGTLTHELGHALFLSGHSEDDDDVMFPSSDAQSDAFLTDRDENSLLTAYCGQYPSRGRRDKVVPDTTIRISEPRAK